MRDELAQALKEQDLYEAGDHNGTILPGFYPGPLDRSLKIRAVLRSRLNRRNDHESHRNLARNPDRGARAGRRGRTALSVEAGKDHRRFRPSGGGPISSPGSSRRSLTERLGTQ